MTVRLVAVNLHAPPVAPRPRPRGYTHQRLGPTSRSTAGSATVERARDDDRRRSASRSVPPNLSVAVRRGQLVRACRACRRVSRVRCVFFVREKGGRGGGGGGGKSRWRNRGRGVKVHHFSPIFRRFSFSRLTDRTNLTDGRRKERRRRKIGGGIGVQVSSRGEAIIAGYRIADLSIESGSNLATLAGRGQETSGGLEIGERAWVDARRQPVAQDHAAS